MANCTNCGKPLKQGAKFCVSCGTAVPEKSETVSDSTPAPVRSIAPDATTDEVISMLGWFGTLLVLIVPIVGLVLYFVWAFGTGGNLNRRNYCRASLIMMAISLVLSIIFTVTIALTFGSVFTTILGSLY